MLRLLHTADVHLGARHTDLGDRASLQRERQFAAFRSAVDVAIAEAVDLVLIAGDLFDSNTQPRRSVERVGAELGRLARASIRTVIIPGTHDHYDAASIYRAYDLAAVARAGGDWIAVLTPDRADVVFPSLDAVVYGRVFATKRAPKSPLEGLDARSDERASWHIGMVHGALAIPGRTDGDEVVFTEQEIAASGLDYLALGHWHSMLEGRAGGVTYAYPGAPEPVAVDQDGAGQVLIVTLDDRGGAHHVSVEPRRVGQTRCETLDLDVSGVRSQPELIDIVLRHADPNLILDVRLSGLFPDDLDLELDEVERELNSSFFRLRLRDLSIPGLPDDQLPPPDTVLGAFVRNVEARIAELEAGNGASVAETASPPSRAAAEAVTSPHLEAALDVEPTVPEGPAGSEALDAAESIALIRSPEAGPGVETGDGLETGDGHGNGTAPAEPVPMPEPLEAASPPEPAEEVTIDEALAIAEAPEFDGSSETAAPAEAGASAEPEAVVEEMPAAGEAPRGEAPTDETPPREEVPVAAASEGVAEAEAAVDPTTADELADLREVLRLGRHLLEGRQVTL